MTTLLQRIDQVDATITINQRLTARAHTNKKAVNGDTPLLNMSYPMAEVYGQFENFLQTGAINRNWDSFVDLFDNNAVYIPIDRKCWIGQQSIREGLLGQLKAVPNMTFNRIDWYQIFGNKCSFYIWNDLVDPTTGTVYAVPNLTIVYYGGNGKWLFEEDFYDSVTFGIEVIKYLIHDKSAICPFIRNIFNLI